jgi:hypothetical protein
MQVFVWSMLLFTLAEPLVGEPVEPQVGRYLSELSIGEIPNNITMFVETDCRDVRKLFDCSARDRFGMRYVFFDGALSKVSLSRDDAVSHSVLPARLRFNEPVALSISKAEAFFEKKFIVKVVRGSVVATSPTMTSRVGVRYSVVLQADDCGKLKEITERTDF